MSYSVTEKICPSLATETVSAELISVVTPDSWSPIVQVTVILRVFDREKWFTGRVDLGKRIFIDHPDHREEKLFHAATLLLGPVVVALVVASRPPLITPIPQKDL